MAGKYSINKLYMGSIAWRLIAFILDLMNCATAQGGRMPSTLDWSRGFTRQIPEIDFCDFWEPNHRQAREPHPIRDYRQRALLPY
jgi:hypothetical protein